MGNNELATIVKDSGLSQESKVEELMKSFTGYFDSARKLADGAKDIVVTDESQSDLMVEARTKRIELKNLRGEVEKRRKELKEQSLREGRAIDGVSNVIKALIVPVEQHLEKQEKYAEVKEQERLEKRYQERVESLSGVVDDISLYNLKGMSDSAFEKLLNDAKKIKQDQIEAEKKVEEERIEAEKKEREEQEKTRQENIKLKKEVEKREAAATKVRLAQEKKLNAERGKRELAEKRMKAQKEAQEKKEREAREAEEARKKQEEESKRQAILAPDKDKLISLAAEIDKFTLPAVESKEAGDIVTDVGNKLENISAFLRTKAKTL